jgi:hypothetical protein
MFEADFVRTQLCSGSSTQAENAKGRPKTTPTMIRGTARELGGPPLAGCARRGRHRCTPVIWGLGRTGYRSVGSSRLRRSRRSARGRRGSIGGSCRSPLGAGEVAGMGRSWEPNLSDRG